MARLAAALLFYFKGQLSEAALLDVQKPFVAAVLHVR